MSNLFANEEVRRIAFDEDWIEIKAEMSMGDHERLDHELWNLDIIMGNSQLNREEKRKLAQDNPEMENFLKANFRPSHLALLAINIVNWSSPTPVNRDNIAKLHQKVADQLVIEINEINFPEKVAKLQTNDG